MYPIGKLNAKCIVKYLSQSCIWKTLSVMDSGNFNQTEVKSGHLFRSKCLS